MLVRSKSVPVLSRTPERDTSKLRRHSHGAKILHNGIHYDRVDNRMWIQYQLYPYSKVQRWAWVNHDNNTLEFESEPSSGELLDRLDEIDRLKKAGLWDYSD